MLSSLHYLQIPVILFILMCYPPYNITNSSSYSFLCVILPTIFTNSSNPIHSYVLFSLHYLQIPVILFIFSLLAIFTHSSNHIHFLTTCNIYKFHQYYSFSHYLHYLQIPVILFILMYYSPYNIYKFQ